MAFASALLMIGDVIQLLAVISDYAGWRRRGLAAPAQFRRRSGPLIALYAATERSFGKSAIPCQQPAVPSQQPAVPCQQSSVPCQQSAFHASSRPFRTNIRPFRTSSWPSVPAFGRSVPAAGRSVPTFGHFVPVVGLPCQQSVLKHVQKQEVMKVFHLCKWTRRPERGLREATMLSVQRSFCLRHIYLIVDEDQELLY